MTDSSQIRGGEIPISRALISVSDKHGLAELGRFLAARGVAILSTGGSARALSEVGVTVVEVADHTGFPEIMDGRVKTLHPTIHGGVLARRDLATHRDAMAAHGIAPIDLVVVNLYPFEATVAAGAGWDDCIENIDIGGPGLIRAAAKNHDFVTVVTDPADYAEVMREMAAHDGATTAALRRRLAERGFARTAGYDARIASWFARQRGETWAQRLDLEGRLSQSLRYGENPHQPAALYLGGPARPGVAAATQLQGKALSYNNLNDADAAFELVAEFEAPAAAIIKHASPCGAAVAEDLAAAYRRA
ncbi:MAG: bifunctional phosphoribosylaminoimidazolecarboxamide formyltransferase/IMP cyclohydrolase, partial [Kiloniellales bacterium]